MPNTRVDLVRHGATQLSAEDRFAGATGVELSDEGREQAVRLGDRLSDDDIRAVYCSPMSRTVETARIVAGRCGLDLRLSDGLREIHHGHWEGLTRGDVESRFPRIRRLAAGSVHVRTSRWRVGCIGARACAAGTARHRRAAPGETVLVVSHKATIRLLLSSLLGFDPRGYRDRLDQAPACLNVLEFRDAVRARLMLFNDTSHYADRPRTPARNLSKWWDTGAPAA